MLVFVFLKNNIISTCTYVDALCDVMCVCVCAWYL